MPYDGKILISGNPGLMIALKIISIISIIIIIYYAVIYNIFYHIDKNHFRCSTSDDVHGYEFVYFSIVTFATVGYGDIYANSSSVRMVVSAEIMNSIIILIFVVSSMDYMKNLFARFDSEKKAADNQWDFHAVVGVFFHRPALRDL